MVIKFLLNFVFFVIIDEIVLLCKGVEIVVLKIGILGEIDKINFYIYDYVVVSYKFLKVW